MIFYQVLTPCVKNAQELRDTVMKFHSVRFLTIQNEVRFQMLYKTFGVSVFSMAVVLC